MARNQSSLLILDEDALTKLLNDYGWYVRTQIYDRDGEQKCIASAWAIDFARDRFAQRAREKKERA